MNKTSEDIKKQSSDRKHTVCERNRSKKMDHAASWMLRLLLLSLFWTCSASTASAGDMQEQAAAPVKELPVVRITTDGEEMPTCQLIYPPEEDMPGVTITNAEYVKGHVTVSGIPGAPANAPMKIKVRGNSSVAGRKKSYKIKLDNAAELLGRDGSKADREWLLLNNGDSLKTWLGFLISEQAGMEWTPEVVFVDVEFNDEPQSIYLLAESVKVSPARVNIGEKGALFEDDTYWWNENGNYFQTAAQDHTMGYTWKYPEDVPPTDPSIQALQARMQRLENCIMGNGRNLSKEIDLNSWADWLLVRDILGHGDPAGSNLYFYTDDIGSGKIKMGPLWDFDAAFEVDENWSLQHIAPTLPFARLMSIPAFRKTYIARWRAIHPTLEQTVNERLDLLISTQGEALERSRRRNSDLWGKRPSLAEETAQIRNDLHKQLAWMTAQLGN